MAVPSDDHGPRFADVDGAYATLAQGLELHGIRLPSLAVDVVTLADEQVPARSALIRLGSVTPETARRLGEALMVARGPLLGGGFGAP